MPKSRKVIVASDRDDFNQQAVAVLSERASAAIVERGVFFVALAGGATVTPIYELFAKAEGIDWNRVKVFMGDERFVPQDNAYSNFRQAREALLDHVPIPASNVFPVPVIAPTPREGAREYACLIREHLHVPTGEMPVFDLIHLGMGTDGHTASLFPYSSALSDRRTKAIVRMNHAGLAPWVDRVTFSFGLINSARCVLITAAGRNKAERVKEAFSGGPNVWRRTPIAAVAPTNGELIWLLDSDAGILLK